MYGYRGRIGLVAPSRGDTMLYEFYKVAPPGVMGVPYSCELTRLERGELERVRGAYVDGVRAMVREEVDVIYVGGTPPQLYNGLEAYGELLAHLRSLTDIPLITSVESERAALRAGGVTKATVLAPYTDQLADNFAGMLTDQGIDVVHMENLGVSAAYEISFVTDYLVYQKVLNAFRAAKVADGIHITCPRWPTLFRLAELEEVTGVQVTSSCQASIWLLLGILGVRPASGQWGSLFDKDAVAASGVQPL